ARGGRAARGDPLRGVSSAASLKHRDPGGEAGEAVTPRSQLRGLIEAASRARTHRAGWSLRGVSSAASLKLLVTVIPVTTPAGTPRSQLRGLIEAGRGAAAVCPASSALRGVSSAASLKHAHPAR